MLNQKHFISDISQGINSGYKQQSFIILPPSR